MKREEMYNDAHYTNWVGILRCFLVICAAMFLTPITFIPGERLGWFRTPIHIYQFALVFVVLVWTTRNLIQSFSRHMREDPWDFGWAVKFTVVASFFCFIALATIVIFIPPMKEVDGVDVDIAAAGAMLIFMKLNFRPLNFEFAGIREHSPGHVKHYPVVSSTPWDRIRKR